MVMTARYGPQARSAGKPKTNPATAASTTPSASATRKGHCGKKAMALSPFRPGGAVRTATV